MPDAADTVPHMARSRKTARPDPPRILGIGGAHIDRRGRLTGLFVPGASNPGRMHEDVGGVVFNALRCASQCGAMTSLISLRGGDPAGERIAAAIEAAGVADHSAVFLDRSSPSYTALIDRDGELIAGFADMDLYDLFARQLRRTACRAAIAEADAILCDANLPEAALEFVVAQAAAGIPVHAVGISPAKVVRLSGLLDRVDVLFLNRREAAALTGLPAHAEPGELARKLRAMGLRRGVMTGGGGDLIAFEADDAFTITPPIPSSIVDVTGAGDAIAGVAVAWLAQGTVLTEAVRAGMAAARLAIEAEASVPRLDAKALAAALADVPTAKPIQWETTA